MVRMTQHPSRALLGGSAAALATLGVLFTTVLVADSGDNAYSYLLLVGWALIFAAVPFAIAVLLPAGSRRALMRAALVLLALIGLLGLALLILSVVVIPTQNYESDAVLINHLIGLIALIVTLAALAVIYRRRLE